MVFSLAISVLLLQIYALARCIKSSMPIGKKCLWLALILLIGLGSAEFNWLNGMFGYSVNDAGDAIIKFLAFPMVDFSQKLYRPFMIEINAPLGAIIFLLARFMVGQDNHEPAGSPPGPVPTFEKEAGN
jgi:hypothetical protein